MKGWPVGPAAFAAASLEARPIYEESEEASSS
jgi:hypothetical protein